MASEHRDPAGYAEWGPRSALQRYVACTWTGGRRPMVSTPPEPVLPDGCMDVIWDGHRLFVTGPDTGPNATTPAGSVVVGLRFRPGAGPSFLGAPADTLRDQWVDLEELWPGAGPISEELARTSGLRDAAGVLEAEVARRLPTVSPPDPLVEAAARSWKAGATRAETAGLADRTGISERQLHRRFVAAVGYGPRMLQRVLRLQAFLMACGEPGVGLAELAARSGYADQAHLTREARVLAGVSPARLRLARVGVRIVQDDPAAGG